MDFSWYRAVISFSMSYTSLLVFLFLQAASTWGSGLDEKYGGAASGYYRKARSQDESGILRGRLKKWEIGNLPRFNNNGNTLRMGDYFLPPKGEIMLEPAVIENINRPPSIYEPSFVGAFVEHPILGRIYESPVMPNVYNSLPIPNVYNPPGSGHMYEPIVVGTMHSPSRPEQMFGPPGIGRIFSPPVMSHMYDSQIIGNIQDPSGLGHTSMYSNPALSHMYDAQWLGSINDPTISEHFYRVPVAAGIIYEPSVIGHVFDSSISGAVHDEPQIIHPESKLEPVMGHSYEQPGYIYPAPRLTPIEPHNPVPVYEAGMVGSDPLYEPSSLGLLAPTPIVEHLIPQPIIKKIYNPPAVGTHPEPVLVGSALPPQITGRINKLSKIDVQTGQDQAFTQCQKSPVIPPVPNSQDMGHLVKLVRVLLGTGHRTNEVESSSDNHFPKEEQCTFTSPTIENGDEETSEESPDARKSPLARMLPLSLNY